MYFSVLYDTEYKTIFYSQKIFLSNTCYFIVQYYFGLFKMNDLCRKVVPDLGTVGIVTYEYIYRKEII